MRIQSGYPDAQAERNLLSVVERREIVAKLAPQMEAVELLALQQQVKQVFVSPVLLDYVQAVLPGVASHRLQSVQDVQASDGNKLVRELVESVPIP